MGADGWSFGEAPDSTPDTVNQAEFLRDVYVTADRTYTGRVTVPVLWDREHATIVNNESSEIIRMFDQEFDAISEAADLHFWPEQMRSTISYKVHRSGR